MLRHSINGEYVNGERSIGVVVLATGQILAQRAIAEEAQLPPAAAAEVYFSRWPWPLSRIVQRQ